MLVKIPVCLRDAIKKQKKKQPISLNWKDERSRLNKKSTSIVGCLN